MNIEDYKKNGFIVIKNFFDNQIQSDNFNNF